MILVLSIVLATTGCLGLLLAGKGKWQGWAIGLAAQPVWAAFAIETKAWGLLVSCLMYGTVYGKNLLAWRRSAAEGEPGVDRTRVANPLAPQGVGFDSPAFLGEQT